MGKHQKRQEQTALATSPGGQLAPRTLILFATKIEDLIDREC